ncbi:MAG: CAAX prenyl protease-related protein [Acidobacteria bacterium]|nr:CAAX prenyl protease-related protein [Acidobacteriota bacterium]MBI3471774.1 CAAX prenyl protease-related protein [Candidatus Solibacter usitatus]
MTAYVAPFAAFLVFLAAQPHIPLGPEVAYPIRVVVVSAILWVFSRRVLDMRPANPLGSVLLGAAVFAIWIGPDTFWPGYRAHWLFHNSVLGEARSTASDALKGNLPFLIFRTFGCAIMVPVLEELFWRGWLSRWLIDSRDFLKVPLGAYTAFSFWMGSLLFASEHGPYWEVGLAAGCLYNAWMIRTKNLANCILAHGVTNACLSAWVLTKDQWQYWQ